MSAPARKQPRLRLGDLLVNAGVLTDDQLATALQKQKQTRRRLGEVLIQSGMVDGEALLQAISQQLNIARLNLNEQAPSPEVARKLPELIARRLRALVVAQQVDGFLVAMADPTDLLAQDEIERQLGSPISVAVVGEQELLSLLDTIYVGSDRIEALAEELGEEIDATWQADRPEDESADALVSRLITSLLEEAIRAGASDIHVEPGESSLSIRFRIDGFLREQPVAQKNVAASLVSRLKLSAGLNIAERRLPQDGRFRVSVRGRTLDVRLATMPTQHGESVVMRLLDQSAGLLDLGQLGMPDDLLTRLRRILETPHGMLLVTGPTGSGKSTTLYAALSELSTAERKIITIEDPVEYRLPRVNQVQVQSQIGLDFARVLRAALRQDPDIVLIGEMRDRETVDIGLRAAITGHLVMSTLHTNDAPSTAVRLIDMGAPGFLIASALQGILAQRLIRRLCSYCVVPYQPDSAERSWLAAVGPLGDAEFRAGRGCSRCNQSGYSGRVGVYELLVMDDACRQALRQGDGEAFVQAARSAPGYRPLVLSALQHAADGITSLAEVLRVSGGEVPAAGELRGT